MTFEEYQAAASRTRVHPDTSVNLSVKNAMGLAGETGEVVDLLKKHHYHGKPLDVDELRKELGDVLWYLTDLCTEHGLTLADVAAANIAKLQRRYPDGFVKGGGVR